MRAPLIRSGFSLVEILISLLLVSIVAVSITGLQKLVMDQSRDNFSHASVIELVTVRFAEIKMLTDLQAFNGLHDHSEEHTLNATLFTLTWQVKSVVGLSASSSIYEVEARITWLDAMGERQQFIHSEQISQAMLFTGAEGTNAEDFPYIVPNLLNTTQVGYFDATLSYQTDAYVIFNSQLLHATSPHLLSANGERNIAPINQDGEITSGWIQMGRIDNTQLADLFRE